MSFLSKLFRKRPPYVHPIFGTMTFMKIGPGKSYWEGRSIFPPTRATIEVFVDGDQSGVAAGTEDFYEQIQKQYRAIAAAYRTEIDQQVGRLSKKQFPAAFDAAYRLSSVSVVDTRIRKEWNLGFECLFDENLSVSVEMEDWEHGVVVVDS